jgi:sugar phosphate permease
MHVKNYKRLPMAGLAVAALCCLILAGAADRLPFLGVEVVLTALSLGLGTILPTSTVAIQNAVAPHQLGTATATANFFRSLGGAFCVAIFGAIVLGLSGVDHAGVLAGAAAGAELSPVFRWVFAAAGLGIGGSLFFLWRMEMRPLRSSVEEALE